MWNLILYTFYNLTFRVPLVTTSLLVALTFPSSHITAQQTSNCQHIDTKICISMITKTDLKIEQIPPRTNITSQYALAPVLNIIDLFQDQHINKWKMYVTSNRLGQTCQSPFNLNQFILGPFWLSPQAAMVLPSKSRAYERPQNYWLSLRSNSMSNLTTTASLKNSNHAKELHSVLSSALDLSWFAL